MLCGKWICSHVNADKEQLILETRTDGVAKARCLLAHAMQKGELPCGFSMKLVRTRNCLGQETSLDFQVVERSVFANRRQNQDPATRDQSKVPLAGRLVEWISSTGEPMERFTFSVAEGLPASLFAEVVRIYFRLENEMFEFTLLPNDNLREEEGMETWLWNETRLKEQRSTGFRPASLMKVLTASQWGEVAAKMKSNEEDRARQVEEAGRVVGVQPAAVVQVIQQRKGPTTLLGVKSKRPAPGKAGAVSSRAAAVPRAPSGGRTTVKADARSRSPGRGHRYAPPQPASVKKAKTERAAQRKPQHYLDSDFGSDFGEASEPIRRQKNEQETARTRRASTAASMSTRPCSTRMVAVWGDRWSPPEPQTLCLCQSDAVFVASIRRALAC